MKNDKIDNVLDWLKADWPSEWEQEERHTHIASELTFSWLVSNLTHIDECDQRLGNIDSALREKILSEATIRLFDTLINENGFMKWALVEELNQIKERR